MAWVQTEMKKAQQGVEEAKARATQIAKEAETLPNPTSDLGDAPTVDVYESVWMPALRLCIGYDTCRTLRRDSTEQIRRRGTTWTYFARHAFSVWTEEGESPTGEAGNPKDGWAAHIVRQQMFTFHTKEGYIDEEKNIQEAKTFSYKLISLLAENEKMIDWALGLAKKFLSPKARAYTAERLQNAWQALQTDFATLDKQVRAAEEGKPEKKKRRRHGRNRAEPVVENCAGNKLPLAYDFGLSWKECKRGNYITGILLRRWREQELTNGPGGGDAWMKIARTAVQSVAAGLEIELSDPPAR